MVGHTDGPRTTPLDGVLLSSTREARFDRSVRIPQRLIRAEKWQTVLRRQITHLDVLTVGNLLRETDPADE
jgi:hypothetical protein